MTPKKIDGQYRARFTDERGRDRKKRFKKGTTRETAERWERDALARIDRIKEGLEVRDRNPEKLTVGDVTRRWLKGKSDRDTLTVTRHVLMTSLADVRLERVTSATIRDHLDGLRPSPKVRHLVTKDLAPLTLNQIRRHLVSIFDYAIDRELLVGVNPVRRVKMKKAARRSLTTLTVDEVGRLLAAAPFPDRAILAVALHGLRRGEVWRLKIGDVDLQRWEIHVRKSKTGRQRVVPIHTALRPTIQEAVDRSHSTFLFPGVKGGARSDKTTMRRDLVAALKAAGIARHVRPHDLRHTCATLMLQAGAGLAAVKEVLGHSTIRLTVDTYGHLVVDDARQAVEKMAIKIGPPRAVKEGS